VQNCAKKNHSVSARKDKKEEKTDVGGSNPRQACFFLFRQINPYCVAERSHPLAEGELPGNWGYDTVIAQVAYSPEEAVAVMVALPAFFAVTVPVLETVAMVVLLDFQVIEGFGDVLDGV